MKKKIAAVFAAFMLVSSITVFAATASVNDRSDCPSNCRYTQQCTPDNYCGRRDCPRDNNCYNNGNCTPQRNNRSCGC